MTDCEFCKGPGGEILWQDERLRVVYVDDSDYPGFCRVIWQTHVREMTDLEEADRTHCMRAVFGVEAVLRELLEPHKINLASLGNMTPHVHWHVIPRFTDDTHFPQPIWGTRQRNPRPFADREALPDAIAGQLAAVLVG